MTPLDGPDPEPRLVEALDEFLQALESGRAIDREALVERYPDLSAELGPCLDALAFVHATPPSMLASESLGDFQLIRPVGKGGMGVVYEAVQRSLGRRVALKVLPFAAVLDERTLQRFRFEAQAAALLHHSHIVPVHAVGEERGVHFYAMQFIDGRTLQQIVAELRARETGASAPRSGPLEAITPGDTSRSPAYCRAVARLGFQAADALDHAHRQGVIHRDVKPANLMVDARGHLWITDFGLATSTRDVGLTMTGDLLGTVRYMSPEQTRARRAPVDHRTDVYSVGATLYEALTLRAAFPGADAHVVLSDIARRDPEPLRRINPAVAPELETIVLKALAKEPAARYDTAGDLAADLRRFLDHQPIRARPPTLFDRSAKWARRHRALVAAAIVFLALAVVGLAVSTVVVAREKDRAETALATARTSFERAVAAVDAMLNEVGSSGLANTPAMTQVRRRLLERALVFYEEFVAEAPDHPELALERARIQRRVAVLLGMLGRPEEAGRAMVAAVALLEALPAQPAATEELARAWEDRARLELAQGLRSASRASVRRARGEWERLPATPAVVRHLGRLGAFEGWILHLDGDAAAAQAALRAVIAGLERSEEPLAARDRAVVRRDLARILRHAEPAEAERLFAAASAELDRLSGDHRALRAEILRDLAVQRSLAGRLDEGLPCFAASIALLEDLVRAYPGIPERRSQLADSFNARGVMFFRAQRNAEAEADLRAAIDHRAWLVETYPDVPGHRRWWSIHLMNLGFVRRAGAGPEDALPWLQKSVEVCKPFRERAWPAEATREVHHTDFLPEASGRTYYGPAAQSVDYAKEVGPVYAVIDTLLMLERYAEAEEVMHEYGENRAVRARRARYLAKLCPDRDPAEAVALAQASIDESDPARDGMAGPYEVLGMALYRAGRHEDARAALDKAIELGEHNDALFFLAMTRWRLGDAAGARAAYEQAVHWAEKGDASWGSEQVRAETEALLR